MIPKNDKNTQASTETYWKFIPWLLLTLGLTVLWYIKLP